MRCTRCGTCCQQTDMLLSDEDITRLQQGGYSKDYFVRYDSEGYVLLKNRQGHCVFYIEMTKCCDVYEIRPSGCQVYPVIHDEESGIVLDSICPAQNTISKEEKAKKGKQVIELLDQIDREAEKRQSK
jgi:uncharacterized protein